MFLINNSHAENEFLKIILDHQYRRKLLLIITFLITLVNNAKSEGKRWPPWGTTEVASIVYIYIY